MNKSEQINELATALAKAQGAIKGVIKDASNPFFKSKYADLASCWDAIREPLSTNGLSVIQTTEQNPDAVIIETTLLHSSGQWVSGTLAMKPTKNDPQGIGSAMTYARRYGLMAITGIAPEDDDGNAGSDQKTDTTTDVKKATKKEKEQPKTLLSKEQLVEKMATAVNQFELTARKIKYKADYEALTPEDQVDVRTAADKRKSELKESDSGDN